MIIKTYKLSNCEKLSITPAKYERSWMDENSGFAYRCLPLSIANQFGWNINCPVSFKATWNGNYDHRNAFKINFGEYSPETILVSSHFGQGILTFSLPFLFRTEKSYGLFIRGPTNYIKHNVTYLDAFVETDWVNFTFTYNIKFQKPNIEVEFKEGEPLLSFFPFNLESMKDINIEISDINENKELNKNFSDYSELRKDFNDKQRGPGEWMKDYYKGDKAERKSIGCPFLNSFGKYIHFTNLKLNNPHNKS